VGVVQKVRIENSYKTAYIKTYNDTLHPDNFFLIADPKPYLTSEYDKSDTDFDSNSDAADAQENSTPSESTISSIPEAVQTQDNVVDPSEFEIPKEKEVISMPKPPVVLRHPKPKKRKPKKRVAPKTKPVQPPAEAPTPEPSKAPTPKPKSKHPSAMDFINGR
jgi:outer membrane biosynthesis protein TonB